MHSHFTIKNPSHQKGLALVILIVVIALAYISYFFSELSISDIKYQQDVKTMAALKKAKQALLAYAMNYPDRFPLPLPPITQGPGNFPCPALLDGEQVTFGAIGPGSSCNPVLAAPGAIGRYPWKTLETGELYDGSGELLWYAISKNYAAVANGEINTSTIGQITTKNRDGTLRVDGASNDAIVAVIIAPGKQLIRDDGVVQSRATAVDRLNPINYLDIAFSGDALEEDNADYINENANNGFIPGPILNAANAVIVNDQIEIITYEDIMPLVHAKVASEIALVMNSYADVSNCGSYLSASIFDPTKADGAFLADAGVFEGYLPVDALEWANVCVVDLLPDWVVGEDWHRVTYYEFPSVPPVCAPPDCITVMDGAVINADNVEAILVFAGRIQAGQDRSPATAQLSDYFEGQNDDANLGIDPAGLIYDMGEIDDYIRVMAP